jgi:hypothetical protein
MTTMAAYDLAPDVPLRRFDGLDGLRYLRHANFVARTDVIGMSFESANFPGSYLRHYDSQVWSANGTGGTWNRPQMLTADSTWSLTTPWTP